ncbi:HLH-domain-containing protein [Meredithblackwellia eburnea MCA 4105]
MSHSKVEGFYIPSSSAATTTPSSQQQSQQQQQQHYLGLSLGQQHQPMQASYGFSVDPSHIFSNSNSAGSNGTTTNSNAYLHQQQQQYSRSTLTDFDLGLSNDDLVASFSSPTFNNSLTATANSPPPPLHSYFHQQQQQQQQNNPNANSLSTYDSYDFTRSPSQQQQQQHAASQAMFDSLSRASVATSIPHYLGPGAGHARLSPSAFGPIPTATTTSTTTSTSSPRDQKSPASFVNSNGAASSNPTTAGGGAAGTPGTISATAADSPDTPANQTQYGSYTSSVGGESLASVAASSSVPGGGATAKRRGTSTERPSRSTGVGKAPTSGTRSRSARRSNASSAIVIPSSPVPTSSAGHQLAMSMPAGFAGAGSPAGGQPWFASAQAMALHHGLDSNGLGGGAVNDDLDATGWRPSNLQNGPPAVPASAPVGGSSRKKGTLDDVPEDATSKQAALLTEKRRKRRESHNAVERRRRDNINDRITELASLLPDCLLEQANNANDDGESPSGSNNPLSPSSGLPPPSLLGTSPSLAAAIGLGPSTGQQSAAAASAAAKPNKGVILAKSVEYIRYLQQLLALHSQRNNELERMVQDLQISDPNSGQSSSSDMSPGAQPPPPHAHHPSMHHFQQHQPLQQQQHHLSHQMRG